MVYTVEILIKHNTEKRDLVTQLSSNISVIIISINERKSYAA